MTFWVTVALIWVTVVLAVAVGVVLGHALYYLVVLGLLP